ncbi:pilus assembly protein PilY [Variovorax sp. Root411]|nr:pilus assembly protein PilY [Variovorax sp. Root411]
MLCGLVLAQAAGHAAQYPLAQAPRNTAVKEPEPNVIVSVDNSGSMAWSSRASEGKETSAGTPTRMEALKTALRNNFSAANIPNDRIRLSWQAMNNNKDNSCVGFFGDTAAGTYQAGRCLVNGRANANLVRSLDDGHRANFMSWVDALAAGGGTPLHAMMTRAGEYMKTTGQFNPYSDDPGVEGATQSSCRRSFHIFMTDGDYNLFGLNPDPAALSMPGIGNADGTGRALPDAVAYVPRAPYKDDAGAVNDSFNWAKDANGNWRPTAEYRPTLADMAFHYWASDLQPGVSNNLKKIVAAAGNATVGAATVPEYWNPRNDPATWQHLTTYTIGFGAASSWAGAPAISGDASQPTYSGDYTSLVDGSMSWSDPLANTLATTSTADGYNGFMNWNSGSASGYWHEKSSNAAAVRMDLWHAALNSRGTFTPASNAQALGDAFRSILAQILLNTSTSLTSISASSSRASTATAVYQAGYDTADWSGKLTATRFGSNGKLAATPAWSARELLDMRMATAGAYDSNRKVLSFSGTAAAAATHAAATGSGVPFRWTSLSDVQKAALQGSTDTASSALGQGVLNFLRGDRSNEGTGLGLRTRTHVLGDIVGSSVTYAGQPRSGFTHDGYATFASTIARAPMVYVGANDGMLHAFNAGTGEEAFAYVPEGLYGTAAAPQLKKLSESTYSHRYYVDGSPFVADIYMGSTANATATNTEKAALWRSYLVGTLGAGGKGYFVLDVTKPENIDETNAARVAVLDTTALADDDLGHQFQQPTLDSFSRRALQVAPLNNGRRALILGNGYNSASEKAVLWIQYLDGDKSVLKIYAPATQVAGTGNGLSAPQVVDRNGDGKVDYVYAGDLLGKLWKFDLSPADSSKWKATLGSGATASSLDNAPLFAAGATQPITAAPVVVDHPRGGYMVVFGTGRLFASGDESSTAQQYLYGVWDRANGSTGTAALTDLVAQTIGAGTVKEGDVEFRTASSNSVSYSGSGGKRGWYLQLGTAGERIVYPGDALSGSAGLFSSTVPGSASNSFDCAPGTSDDGWSMVIDFFSGAVPDGIAYNGSTSALGSYLGFRNHSGRDDIVFRPQSAEEKGKHVICNAAGDCNETELPQAVRRFGWRNLISSN